MTTRFWDKARIPWYLYVETEGCASAEPREFIAFAVVSTEDGNWGESTGTKMEGIEGKSSEDCGGEDGGGEEGDLETSQ